MHLCAGYNSSTAEWSGSILLVSQAEQPPLLLFQDGHLQPFTMEPILLDSFGRYGCAAVLSVPSKHARQPELAHWVTQGSQVRC